ncbi:MAG: glycosyltransferase family 4 protein [Chloroflexota bacterium]
MQVIGNVAVGGAEHHLLDLVDGLVRRNVRVRIICPRRGPLSQALEDRGVSTAYLEMADPRPGDEYGLNRAVVEKLVGWFSDWQPDVVHSHLYPAHLHASLAAIEAEIAAVIHTAHTLIVRPGDVLLGRLTRGRIIATSAAVANGLVAAGVTRNRVEVIYNGVGRENFAVDRYERPSNFADLEIPSGPIVGTVARLSHEKGVDQLIRALAIVARSVPTVTALIVGDGPDAALLRELAADLGLVGHVRFLGTRADVARLNQLFDIFVLPSREEACSMALLEAMAAGRAVLATHVGGSAELVDDEITGVLVAPDDPEILGHRMVEMLSNPLLRSSLGAAARKKVAAEFTLERMVSQTLACYERALTEARRAS